MAATAKRVLQEKHKIYTIHMTINIQSKRAFSTFASAVSNNWRVGDR